MDNVFVKLGLVFGVVLILIGEVVAIPNSTGVTTFNFRANMRLEDFVAREVVWQEDAKLAGDWELWKDDEVKDSSIEVLHLLNSAIVFGVEAEEVTVQRRDNQILAFKLVFEPKKKQTIDQLQATLQRNASVWSGEKLGSSKINYQSSTYSFKKEDSGDRVVLMVKPTATKEAAEK